MIEEATARQMIRPLYRGAFLFFSLGGIAAIAVSFLEDPYPWKFQISGTAFVLFFGYLGVIGKTPKWLQEHRR